MSLRAGSFFLRRIRTSRLVHALVQIEPTEAEVRACRISLGFEAIGRLIVSASCPHCRTVHDPDLAHAFRTLQEGWNALIEDGKATRATLRELRKEMEDK